jgi:hypothetical protein
MSKQSTKPELSHTPKATDTVVAITEQVLAYRNDERPTLSSLFRITGAAARMLRVEEREAVANTAALALAKKHNLLGSAG